MTCLLTPLRALRSTATSRSVPRAACARWAWRRAPTAAPAGTSWASSGGRPEGAGVPRYTCSLPLCAPHAVHLFPPRPATDRSLPVPLNFPCHAQPAGPAPLRLRRHHPPGQQPGGGGQDGDGCAVCCRACCVQVNVWSRVRPVPAPSRLRPSVSLPLAVTPFTMMPARRRPARHRRGDQPPPGPGRQHHGGRRAAGQAHGPGPGQQGGREACGCKLWCRGVETGRAWGRRLDGWLRDTRYRAGAPMMAAHAPAA